MLSWRSLSCRCLRSGGAHKRGHALQVVGVALTLLLVDSAGRRPLMLWGSGACTAALLLLAAGDWRRSPVLMLAAMCLFLLAFSASYAGLFWILCSELFSMQAKASAASAATAMLFAGGVLCRNSGRVPVAVGPWTRSALSCTLACAEHAAATLVPSPYALTRHKCLAQAQRRTWLSCLYTRRWERGPFCSLPQLRRPVAYTAGLRFQRQRVALWLRFRRCFLWTGSQLALLTAWLVAMLDRPHTLLCCLRVRPASAPFLCSNAAAPWQPQPRLAAPVI